MYACVERSDTDIVQALNVHAANPGVPPCASVHLFNFLRIIYGRIKFEDGEHDFNNLEVLLVLVYSRQQIELHVSCGSGNVCDV